MSRENVEIVRGYYEVLSRWLDTYWANPVPLDETPDEVIEPLDPDVEWDWAFEPRTFRGREQLFGAVADWIEAIDDWRVEVEELIDAGNDHVFATISVSGRGKGSGAQIEQRIFTALTIRNGKITRIDDYTDRAEALEAAGLSE
jgi:ketosteroid isomerase-like protein